MYTYLMPEDDGLLMREAGEWASEKLFYVERYIRMFETSMREKWPDRNYLDLLAGPGKNRLRDTGSVLLGSPLLALTAEHPFTGYYFVESGPEDAKALRERCDASGHAGRVRVFNDDCNVVVDQIVADLKHEHPKSLNLAFLDPEGLEMQWATVAKLASVPRMDLIINYPEGGLNRMMPVAVDSGGDTAVDRFFGDRGWRNIYAGWQRSPSGSVHWDLIDFYRNRLQALGYVEVRRDDEIGDEPLMRNTTRNAPLYRLLFASKHPLGKRFWNAVTRRDIDGQARLFDPGVHMPEH
jgi:three-Cys-motif partner protein